MSWATLSGVPVEGLLDAPLPPDAALAEYRDAARLVVDTLSAQGIRLLAPVTIREVHTAQAKIAVAISHGDGQTAKVANQIIVALNIEAVAEALLFAAACLMAPPVQAQRYPTKSVRVIVPSGPGSFEPLSGQAHMTGIPVEVTPA